MPHVHSSFVTRRQFLRLLCLAGLAACSQGKLPRGISKYLGKSQAPIPDDRRTGTSWAERGCPHVRALLCAGGRNQKENSSSFFLDALLWYHLIQEMYGAGQEDLRVLYYDGHAPCLDCLLGGCRDKQQQEETRALFAAHPPSAMPIDGSLLRASVLDGLSWLAQAPADISLFITNLHGFVSVCKGVELAQGGEISSVIITTDGYVHDYEVAQLLKDNQSQLVVAILSQCSALYFPAQVAWVPNLAVFASNGGSGKAEISYLHTVSAWSEAFRQTLLASADCDIDKDGCLSLDEIQRSILASSDPNLFEICALLSGNCREIHPAYALGAALTGTEVVLQYARR